MNSNETHYVAYDPAAIWDEMIYTYPMIESVIVTTETAGGMDAEDEELYRERVRTSGLTSVTTGPERQYRSQAMAVSSEIIDARALRTAPGKVGVYLLLADGVNAQTVIGSVYKALSAYDARPLTDLVTVREANVKTYALNVGYQTDEYVDAMAQREITGAVDEYLAWQNRAIGRPFNPDRLVALLYQAGCVRVIIQPGSAFDNGPVEYVEIEADTRVNGSVSLAVIS